MEKVVKEAKEIAGEFDIDLYLPEEEIQRRDIDEAINIGIKEGMDKGIEKGKEIGIKIGLKQGIKQGIKEGLQQGIEQGVEKGLQQGIKEGIEQKQTELIMNMYRNNVSLELISKYSNLSINKIKQTIKKNKNY